MRLVTARDSNDQFCESPVYSELEAKKVIVARRDFFLWYIPGRAKWTAFLIAQGRALFRVKCQNKPYGLMAGLTCDEKACRMSGPCHQYHAELNLHNISR